MSDDTEWLDIPPFLRRKEPDHRDAEIARLRAFIEEAEHDFGCAALKFLPTGASTKNGQPVYGSHVQPCDCWKREALEGGK